jgi:hypothetical protein
MRTVLRGVIVLVLVAFLSACLGAEDSCGCQYPADAARYDVYLLSGFGEDAELVPTEIRDDSGRDPAVVAVTALLATTPPRDAALVNGWAVLEEPIVEVRGVSHRDGVVTVNLSGDMWDPYPAARLVVVPDGRLTVQQLVWTVQQALGTDDPVLVTALGKRMKGVWLDRMEWPVSADPAVLAPSPAP